MQKTTQQESCPQAGCHANATASAMSLCVPRSSLWCWIDWFTLYGAENLISLCPRWPFAQICALLVCRSPGDSGYQRSRWLSSARLVWRRAALNVIRIKMKKWRPSARLWMNVALSSRCFTRMTGIHLNPKIIADWQLRGQQKRVVTPGQNEKYYLAGALHCGTGKPVMWAAAKPHLYLSVC